MWEFSSSFVLLAADGLLISGSDCVSFQALQLKMPSAQDPFYVVKDEIQESVSWLLASSYDYLWWLDYAHRRDLN